jgi:hypothetical protein
MMQSLLSVLAATPLAAYIVTSKYIDHRPFVVLDSVVGRALLLLVLLFAFMFDLLVAVMLVLALALFFIQVEGLQEKFGSYLSQPHIDWESKEKMWNNGAGVTERPYA